MYSEFEIAQFARSGLGLGSMDEIAVEPLSQRGSDRNFYRVGYSQGSVIVIAYNPQREENSYYAQISRFLNGIKVRVPAIIRDDPQRCLTLMEDLGNADLWTIMSGLGRSQNWAKVSQLYKKALDSILRLHSFPLEKFPVEQVKTMPGFDLSLYSWERGYFREYFLAEICALTLSEREFRELEDELSALARRILSNPQCLIHRDFQSQNIMVRQEEVFFIDYQGMRQGCGLYDIASLLYDPYVLLDHGTRTGLLEYYLRNLKLYTDSSAWSDFEGIFYDAAAQRLMQALGAYGFLGKKRGLASFLAYIPAGLNNLIDVATRSGKINFLKSVALRCLESLPGL